MDLPNPVCVFCGSSPGGRPAYKAAAVALGRLLAANGITLVYGGASVGLMGVLADAALTAGGRVVGVIPKTLVDWEVAHEDLTELHVVSSMHERKALMAELAGAFIAMPGGFGTIDELCEIVTWSQLGLHRKPIGLLNVEGFFDSLLKFFDVVETERFMHPLHRGLVFQEADPANLLEKLGTYDVPRAEKWVDRTPA